MTGSSMRWLRSALMPITLGLAMTCGAQARRPDPSAAPRPSETAIDVRIVSAPDIVLAGTLHLPAGRQGQGAGEGAGEGPFPLVVLIQGHGPNGRGGYGAIIRDLTARGIAALEYDKRGIGQSTGIFQEDIGALTADATAAVAAMRRRTDIDGRRIALLGHSQGGVVAPAVAATDPTIAAVVTLAGSVGDGLPYLGRALRNQMIAAGRAPAMAGPAADAATAVIRARIDGEDAQTVARLRAAAVTRFEAAGFSPPQAETALAMIDTDEARGIDRLHAATDMKALHMPVLAVFGGKDRMVVASDEAPAARQALARNAGGRVVVLDGLNHWFQEGAVTGGEEEVATLGPNAGSPRLVALVGDWLAGVLARRTAAGGRLTERQP